MKSGEEMTKILVEKYEISKYRIAKECKVTWSTVQLWYRGVWPPMHNNFKSLLSFYKKVLREKKGVH